MLCQYMLCEHGRLPHEILDLSLREKLIMWEIIKKEAKERKEAARKK